MLTADLRDADGATYADLVMPDSERRGEPWLSFFTPEQMTGLLTRHGFTGVRDVRQRDAVSAALWERADLLRPIELSRLCHATWAPGTDACPDRPGGGYGSGMEPDLDALADAELTYAEHGATRGRMPDGYHHLSIAAGIGSGQDVFGLAASALLHWDMHRKAGLRIHASGPSAEPGVVVAQTVGWGPLALTSPCRVLYTVDEPNRRGFGTAPSGHPSRARRRSPSSSARTARCGCGCGRSPGQHDDARGRACGLRHPAVRRGPLRARAAGTGQSGGPSGAPPSGWPGTAAAARNRLGGAGGTVQGQASPGCGWPRCA
jgi:uncharacterized protein (UPF0548 family)